MNIRGLLLGTGSLALVVGIALPFVSTEQNKYQPRNTQAKEEIGGAMAYLASIRNNVITGEFNPADAYRAEAEVNRLAKYQAKSVGLNWQDMGPDNVGGRTRAILVDKDNHSRIYVGSVSGGLWYSTTGGSSWMAVNDMARSPAISCIAQSAVNGYIYVGTGEEFANHSGNANGSSGFPGKGIYRSTNGSDFLLLPATIPTDTNTTSANFSFVNELAVDPVSGKVYAACNSGFWVSENNGDTWTRTRTGKVTDVQITADRTVVIALTNRFYYSTDYGVTFTMPAGSPAPTGRMELAVAPSDANYIYASCSTSGGEMYGVYRSTDKGLTWTLIGPGGSESFQPYRNQGNYNNIIKVFPNNKDKIILGGIDLWEWQVGGTWTRKSLWVLNSSSSLYIHADHHTYVFHPNYKTASNPNGNEIIYYGSDGGVSRSLNGGQTFHTLNINYNSVQFYTVFASGQGMVVGGTQDNGTLFNDLIGNTPLNFYKIQGGDGGWAAMSHINTQALYTTAYYGNSYRSPDLHLNAAQWFNARMLAMGTPGDNFPAGFVTPQIIWETTTFPNPDDSVDFVATQQYSAGTKVVARSRNNQYPFDYFLTANLDSGDVVRVADPVESRFFLGATGSVWMTRQNLDFSKTAPDWIRIANVTGQTQSLAASKDGNYLFIGTNNSAGGRVYRVSNLLAARDSVNSDVTSAGNVLVVEQLALSSGGRAVVSIAVDPANADRLVVTLGNYGASSPYVYFSNNATAATPTFTGKQGTGLTRLPYMPVYASVIVANNPNMVVIGTEYGLFATEDISATNPQWQEVNAGAARVPVYMLFQQIYNYPTKSVTIYDNGVPLTVVYPGVSNFGAIYAGTHGRGIFRTETFVGIEDNDHIAVAADVITLGLYPNPARDHFQAVVTIGQRGPAMVNIYEISGRLVRSINAGILEAGDSNLKIDTQGLSNGTYIIRVVSGSKSASGKLMVWR